MPNYVLQKTLVKHSDSINGLAFTHDGVLFASGADDGLIIVFRGYGDGKEVRRFQLKAPITALLWHSCFGYTIIAGDACGDVHIICLNNSSDVSASRFSAMWKPMRFYLQKNTHYHTFHRVSGPVHSIVQRGALLAIGSGNAVELIKQGTIGSFSFLTNDSWVTNATCSYLGGHRPASRPTQISRTRGRAARTHGTIASLLRGRRCASGHLSGPWCDVR